MSAVVMRTRSTADGKLRLEIPVGRADAEFDVEVVVHPRPGAEDREAYVRFMREKQGAWQGAAREDKVAASAGSITDPESERPQQQPPDARDQWAESNAFPVRLAASGDPWAGSDAIHRRLASTGRTFSDSVDLIREDRER